MSLVTPIDSPASVKRVSSFGPPAGAGSDPVASAVGRARAAQPEWAAATLAGRLAVLRRWRGRLAAAGPRLARISALGRQRPPLESLTAEVFPLAEAGRFLETNARRLLAPRRLGRRGRPAWLIGVHSELHREPLGVVLVISPWNYPLLLPGVPILQALAAGNAVLIKPAPGTSEALAALVEVWHQAGLPAGLLSLLPEDPASVSAALDAGVDKVIFTGSAGAGQQILAAAARHLVPVTLELGGCDAALVRADANLDLAARALVFGLSLNRGATCMAPRRVFLARSIALELESRLAALLQATPSHSLPPVLSNRLRPLLAEAVAGGARWVSGRVDGSGQVVAPVVLGAVDPALAVAREDLFAPLLVLVSVDSDEEAIRRINDCDYGLGASVFTANEAAGRRLAARLQTGFVTINDVILPTADPRVPFGGRKRSGFGLTRGGEGLLEMTSVRRVSVTRGSFRPAFAPARAGDAELFRWYLQWVHGSGVRQRGRAMVELMRCVVRRKG